MYAIKYSPSHLSASPRHHPTIEGILLAVVSPYRMILLEGEAGIMILLAWTMGAVLLATPRWWPARARKFCNRHWGGYTNANNNPNGQTIPRGERNGLTIGISTISRRYGGVNFARASLWWRRCTPFWPKPRFIVDPVVNSSGVVSARFVKLWLARCGELAPYFFSVTSWVPVDPLYTDT